MVGKLGTAELAAASLGNSFLFMAMSVILGYSTGITPLIAANHSTQNSAKIKHVLKHGFILITLLSIILTVIVFLCRPLLHEMKQTPEVVELAIPYLNIAALSLIPLGLFQVFKQFADGLSQTKYAMIATIVANLLNVLLNYILIYGKFGCPELGIIGAAYGTLISRIVMVIVLFLFLTYKSQFIPYFKGFIKEVLSKKAFLEINALGVPSALQMFFEFGIFTAAIWLSGMLGKNPQAANQIALNASSFTFMFAMGIGVVAIIRVGNQYGIKHYKDLRRIAFSLFLLIFTLDILFAILFFIFNTLIPHVYLDVNDINNIVDNTEVAIIAGELLLIAGVFQLFDGMQAVVLGALKGLQDVKVPTIIVFIAYWVIAFPVCYYLGIYLDYGSRGIWIGLLVGLFCSSILLLFRFNNQSKRLLKQQ